MNYKQFLAVLLAFVLLNVGYAQNADDLLNDLTPQEEQPLLPKKMMITQSIMWGKNGLMRNIDAFKLTPENRAKELKIRRAMLVTHQTLGFATAAGMLAQGIVGAKLYKGNYDLLDLHEGLATGVNIGYWTTAGLALLAPPKALDDRKGISSIKIHRALAILHLSGMIATNVLADKASDPKYKPWHRAAAFTAFGAYAASLIVIKFEF